MKQKMTSLSKKVLYESDPIQVEGKVLTDLADEQVEFNKLEEPAEDEFVSIRDSLMTQENLIKKNEQSIKELQALVKSLEKRLLVK